MIARIVFAMISIGIVFLAPWWIGLLVGIIGVILFPWFFEIIIFGLMYDSAFGSGSAWYIMFLHTGIFTTSLFFGEFIKTKIHV